MSEDIPYPQRTVAILNDGNTAIVVDDNCYVIRNRKDEQWGFSSWIFQEALSVLKTLPDNPREARDIVHLKSVPKKEESPN